MLTSYNKAVFLVSHILHTQAKYEKLRKYWCLFESYMYVWVMVQKTPRFFSILKLRSDLYSRIRTLIFQYLGMPVYWYEIQLDTPLSSKSYITSENHCSYISKIVISYLQCNVIPSQQSYNNFTYFSGAFLRG